jgi:hypothetical protein
VSHISGGLVLELMCFTFKAGLVADTPLSAAAYLDIIPITLSSCLKLIVKTQAIDATSQKIALTTAHEFKVKLTAISEKKVKDVHTELQKRRQSRPAQFDDEEFEAYQTLDNPAWSLWIKFYKEDPANTMKKFLDYLRLPCSIHVVHSEATEESIESSAPIGLSSHAFASIFQTLTERTTPTKNRGKSCGPTIMRIDGREIVAPRYAMSCGSV